MIELQKFLDIMATDCELEVVEDSAFGVLVDGYNYEIELPEYLKEAYVTHFTPGIVTKIFIKEPKF